MLTMIDGHPAKDWQTSAANKLFELGCGLVDAKPGNGKTAVGIFAIDKLFEDGKDHSVLILTPTNHLNEQWHNVIMNNIPNRISNVTIKTFTFMGKKMKKTILPIEYDMMIVDECHKSHSPVFKHIYKVKSKYLLAYNSLILFVYF